MTYYCNQPCKTTKKQCTCPAKYYNKDKTVLCCGRHNKIFESKHPNIKLIEIPKPKRKNMEHAPHELLFALLILIKYLNFDYNLINYENIYDIIEKCENYIKCDKLEHFVTNLKTYLKEEGEHSNKWQNNAYIEINKNETIFQNIKYIYIVGKNEKDFPIIKNLNKEYDRKEVKADIYIEYDNSQFIGISIKKSQDSTKTNWSIYQLLKFINDKLSKYIQEKCIEYIVNMFKEKNLNTKEKNDRDAINKLFYYNIENKEIKFCEYYKTLDKLIWENKEGLCKLFKKYLNAFNVNYPIYEFDGSNLIHINSNENKNNKFKFYNLDNNDICKELYFYESKKEKERNCAKLFYYLEILDNNNNIKKKYKIEVRFKGWTEWTEGTSPQFQFHEIH